MATSDVAKPADLHVPKLTTSNYKIWCELVIEALEGRGIWEYVEGDVTKPQDEKDKEQLRIWRRNNAVAVGIIKGTLSDSQLGHVMGMRDAKEVWATLKGIHQTTDDARIQSLIAEFIQFRLCTTIDEGASTLTRLQSEIGTLDSASKPSDAVKVQTLLAGLGSEYESTLAALQASKTKKFEEVVSQLRMAETRLNGPRTMGPQLARYTSARRKNDVGKEEIKKRRCFHCGKPGHFIKECEDFLAEIRQQILDEKEDDKHQEKKHTTAMTRSPGAWSVSHRNQESDTPW